MKHSLFSITPRIPCDIEKAANPYGDDAVALKIVDVSLGRKNSKKQSVSIYETNIVRRKTRRG